MILPLVISQLPRHKTVVVSLRESDDSDSDVDACGSSQTVFGGLEFMIKEARRTVEVGPTHRPEDRLSVVSYCRKEQNPSRLFDHSRNMRP